MVKSVLAAQYSGLRWWVIQRFSAVVIAVGCVALSAYFVCHQQLDFLEWRILCSGLLFKTFFLFVVLFLAAHAWIGVWTIITDYIKCPALRFLMHSCVFTILLLCVLAALVIMWSI